MRKNYINILSVAFAVVIASASFAQNRLAKVDNHPSAAYSKKSNPVHVMGMVDTLTNHWDLIGPAGMAIDTPTVLRSAGSGFVAGQNDYQDIAQAQKFDPQYGVTSSNGTITNILFWWGAKIQAGGTASFTPTIWADNAGKPGTVIGTGPAFTVADIDTSNAAATQILGSGGIVGVFNMNAALSSPVQIPNNQIFWAGFTYTYANGDTAGLVTSSDGPSGDGPGLSGNFPDASTHTFQQRSDNVWQSYNDGNGHGGDTWADDIALALYPVLDFASNVADINSSIAWVQNSPNPAVTSTSIGYELTENLDVKVDLYDITGTKVLSIAQGVQTQGRHSIKMDVSNLSAGMYFYTLTAGTHQTTQKLNVTR